MSLNQLKMASIKKNVRKCKQGELYAGSKSGGGRSIGGLGVVKFSEP